jgi:hypothetical protein
LHDIAFLSIYSNWFGHYMNMLLVSKCSQVCWKFCSLKIWLHIHKFWFVWRGVLFSWIRHLDY